MQTSKSWFSSDVPAGWNELFIRSVNVAVVAFAILQMKELFDAGTFDTLGTLTDAGLIAGGIFLLNAILMRIKS